MADKDARPKALVTRRSTKNPSGSSRVDVPESLPKSVGSRASSLSTTSCGGISGRSCTPLILSSSKISVLAAEANRESAETRLGARLSSSVTGFAKSCADKELIKPDTLLVLNHSLKPRHLDVNEKDVPGLRLLYV